MLKENIEKTSQVTARLSIEVPSQKVNEHLNGYFENIAKQAKIAGFRPGKAPLAVVKKHYGEEASQSISQHLISEALLETIRKHDLKVILPPTLIAVDSPVENTDFKFEAEVDLRPEVPKIKCEKISIEGVEAKTIEDKDVDAELESVMDQFAEFEEVKLVRPIAKGDLATVSYEGSIDGQKIEKASTENHEFLVGAEQIMPEFETNVLGMSVGDSKDFSIEFPADHPADEIKGRSILFKLKLNAIKTKKVPELNEELLKKLDPKAGSIEDYKAGLKAELVERQAKTEENELRDQISKALVEAHKFEISDRQKKLTAERMVRDRVQRLAQMGATEEQLKGQINELLEDAAKTSDFQIRLNYILEEIVRSQNIEVNEEDLNKRLSELSKTTGASVEDIRKYYSEKDKDESVSRLDRLKMDLADEKALDYALSRAKIKTKRT